jgi:hypothetical protein
MDKIAISLLATEPYNRASIFKAFYKLEQWINRASDGYLFNTRKITASTTLVLSDSIVLVDATAGAVTVTLPPALNAEDKRYTIKKIDASGNAVTIDGNGAETIDGSATKSLATQYKAYEIVSQNGAWWIVSLV